MKVLYRVAGGKCLNSTRARLALGNPGDFGRVIRLAQHSSNIQPKGKVQHVKQDGPLMAESVKA